MIVEVLKENEMQVRQYLEGKTKVIGFLVGAVMKKSGGKANPDLVNKILLKELETLRQ